MQLRQHPAQSAQHKAGVTRRTTYHGVTQAANFQSPSARFPITSCSYNRDDILRARLDLHTRYPTIFSSIRVSPFLPLIERAELPAEIKTAAP